MFLLVSNVKQLTHGKRKKKKEKKNNISFFLRAEIVVRQLDLQLPMQSVPITTNVLSSNPAHCGVYSIQHYMIKFVSDFRQVRLFYPCTLVSSSNKNDRHDIAEILLKVASNTKQYTKQTIVVLLLLQIAQGENILFILYWLYDRKLYFSQYALPVFIYQ